MSGRNLELDGSKKGGPENETKSEEKARTLQWVPINNANTERDT